jgi:hypothetical protein
MGTLTTDCPRLDSHCPHKLATSCRLTSTPNCCACADERAHSRTYAVYIDGVGFVQRGTRWQAYCWFCKGTCFPTCFPRSAPTRSEFSLRHEQRKPARSQRASLTFVVPYITLQTMLHDTGASSLDMTQLRPAPRTPLGSKS